MNKNIWGITAIMLALSSGALAEDNFQPAANMPAPPASDAFSKREGEAEVNINTEKTLTDNIKENADVADGKSLLKLPSVENTWISKLTEENKSAAAETLAGMIEKSRPQENAATAVKRSNASVFDISGAMLRMSYRQIDAALTRRGYKQTMMKLDIPNFIRWRNEDLCRAQGVVGYERLENCVVQMAKKDNHQFIERVAYAKYKTQEDIEVRFTSTFTNNKAYYIGYKSNAAVNIRGNSQKEIYLRNIKVYDFWKKINQKYGPPDNKDDVIWGLGGNKPYMQGGTGRLVLEDPMLRELDYTRMSREDRKFMNTDLYSF